MAEIIAPSGARAKINAAPWLDAKNLKKAIQREVNFDGFTLSEAWVMSQLFKMDGSDTFETALYSCLKHCTYNAAGAPPEEEIRIVPDIFNKRENRGDYVAIVSECIKENLGPLVDSLLLKLLEMGILKKQAKNQTSELTTNAS